MTEAREKPRINPWSVWMIVAIMLGGVVVTFNYRARNQYEAHSARPPYLTKLERDLEALNQKGETIQLSQMRGRIWLGSYLTTDSSFSGAGLAAELKQIYEEFEPAEELYFISFSPRPEEHSPAELAAWLQEQGITGDDWWFLTATEETEGLSVEDYPVSAAKLNPPRPVAGQAGPQHDQRVILVDGKANVRGYYALLHEDEEVRSLEHERLRRDLRYLLDEATGQDSPTTAEEP